LSFPAAPPTAAVAPSSMTGVAAMNARSCKSCSCVLRATMRPTNSWLEEDNMVLNTLINREPTCEISTSAEAGTGDTRDGKGEVAPDAEEEEDDDAEAEAEADADADDEEDAEADASELAASLSFPSAAPPKDALSWVRYSRITSWNMGNRSATRLLACAAGMEISSTGCNHWMSNVAEEGSGSSGGALDARSPLLLLPPESARAECTATSAD